MWELEVYTKSQFAGSLNGFQIQNTVDKWVQTVLFIAIYFVEYVGLCYGAQFVCSILIDSEKGKYSVQLCILFLRYLLIYPNLVLCSYRSIRGRSLVKGLTTSGVLQSDFNYVNGPVVSAAVAILLIVIGSGFNFQLNQFSEISFSGKVLLGTENQRPSKYGCLPHVNYYYKKKLSLNEGSQICLVCLLFTNSYYNGKYNKLSLTANM